jgi:RNA polymerase sigma-32 factor
MFFNGAVASLDEKGTDAAGKLAKRFNTTVGDVRAFAQRMKSVDQSIQAVQPDGRTLADSLSDFKPDPEEKLSTKRERVALIRRLRGAIPALTRRERHILRRRFLSEKRQSLAKIGKELGVSKERVRQLESRALRKLRSVAPALQMAE